MRTARALSILFVVAIFVLRALGMLPATSTLVGLNGYGNVPFVGTLYSSVILAIAVTMVCDAYLYFCRPQPCFLISRIPLTVLLARRV